MSNSELNVKKPPKKKKKLILNAKKLNIPIIARPPLANYFPTENVKSNVSSA